jgi:iron complex outermembrane receptor protein
MKHESSSFAFRPSALAVAIAGALIGTSSQAADEDIFFSELPVVASVSRLPQRLADAPTAVTVIDREIIKASGARDLNDVFRLVPGFQTYPNNTDAARVTYHGLSDEDFSPRVQVLIDGRSQYSPLFRNGVNWATLPVALEDIERIEVVRGSNSAAYGSNAFLGVINIITVDPALVRGFSVSTNYGNQGVRDYTLRTGGKLGEVGDYRFTYQQKGDTGLTNQFDWIDSFSSKLLDFRADFTLTDRDTLQFNAAHVEAITQQGRLAKSGNTLTGGNDPGNPIRDFSQSNSYLQLQWRRALGADEDFQLRYSYAQDWGSEKHTELRTDISWNKQKNLLYAIDGFGDKATRHEIEAVHTFKPLAQTRLAWGAGYRWDALQTEEYSWDGSTLNRRVGRVFGNLEWKPLSWFTGNAGASVENDSLAGWNISPRASGSFHLDASNTIRLGWSQAKRTSSTVDYIGDRRLSPYATATGTAIPEGQVYKRRYLGDKDLEEEKLTSIEIGYLGDWKALRSSLDIRIFQEKIPNRLMVAEHRLVDPGLFEIKCLPVTLNCQNTDVRVESMTSVQKIRIQGIEYQWRWQPFDATRLMLSQAFTRIYGDYLSSALNDPNLTTLSGGNLSNQTNIDLLADRSAPRHSTSALLMQKLPLGFEFSASGYWLDRMKWTRNSEVNGYSRVDVRLGYPFKFAGKGGEVAYTIQSLNGDHGEFKSYGQLSDRVVERRDWLSLRIDL